MTIFLSILLTILKIIGIILLVILGIVLLILLLVLFCPLNYKLEGNLKKEILTSGVHADVRWLWGLLEGGADFCEKKLQVYIRIAMIRKNLFGKEFGKKEEDDITDQEAEEFFQDDEWETEVLPEDAADTPDKEAKKEAADTSVEDSGLKPACRQENISGENEQTDTGNAQPDNSVQDTEIFGMEESQTGQTENESDENAPSDQEKPEDEKASKDLKSKLSGISARIREALEKVAGKVITIPDKVEKALEKAEEKFDSLYGKYEEAAALVGDEGNQAAVKHVLKELLHILGKYLPRRAFLDIQYSLGSPDMTAMVYGAASALPEAYREQWKLDMDFDSEKPYGEGKVRITGRIRLCVAVGALIRLLLDRNVRKIIKMVLKKRKG